MSHRSTTPALPLLIVLLAASCLHHGSAEDTTELPGPAELLAVPPGGRAWVEEAIRKCTQEADAHHDSPVPLAELAWAYYELARAFEPESPPPVELYDAGRQAAYACLEAVPAFAEVVSRSGGVSWPAVQRIPEERRECALALLANWSAWLREQDPGVAVLDLGSLYRLSQRSLEFPDEDGRAAYWAGVVLALPPPEMQPDLERARRLLEEAREKRPGDRSVQLELARVLLRLGERGEAEELLAALASGDATTALDQRVRAEARALLAELPGS